MINYTFATSEFGLTEAGLHRLRSRFVFETIPYSHIGKARVTRGRTVKNWVLLAAFGLLCLSVSVVTGLSLFSFFTSDEPGRVSVQEVVVPVIPAFVGIAAIWQAFQVGDILVIVAGRRRLVFPVGRINVGTNLAELQRYFDERIGKS